MNAMKMSAAMFVALSLAIPSSTLGQEGQEVFLVDRHTNPGFLLKEIPMSPPQLEGSVYLQEEWRPANITLRNGKALNGVEVRYDVLNQLFEVRYEDVKRWLGLGYFERIEIFGDPYQAATTSTYKPMASFDHGEGGLVKVLVLDSVTSVLEQYLVEIKEPTYVPTHHIGNRNQQVLQKKAYYLYGEGGLIPFARNKKSIAALAGWESKELKARMKAKRLDLDRDDHLISLLQEVLVARGE